MANIFESFYSKLVLYLKQLLLSLKKTGMTVEFRI